MKSIYTQHPEQLSKDSFKDIDLYVELTGIEDDLVRQCEVQKLRSRAKELGEANTFDAMCKRPSATSLWEYIRQSFLYLMILYS